MIARAGEPVVGASGASSIGFFVWMIGSWLVATRFALKPFRPAVTFRPTRVVRVASPIEQALAPMVSPRRFVAVAA